MAKKWSLEPRSSFPDTFMNIGYGVAAIPALGLLVTSDIAKNTLVVWKWDLVTGSEEGPPGGPGGPGGRHGLSFIYTLGGSDSPAPMRFRFVCGHHGSGIMAVLPRLHDDTPSPCEQPLVLVTDAGNDTVHIIDVVGRTHAGYLAAPGTIVGPRGIAIHQRAWTSRSGSRSKSKSESGQRSTLVAVTAWKNQHAGHHVVVLYENNGPVWDKVRVIGGNFGFPGSVKGQMHQPYGVRISKDGTQVCVCDKQNSRVIFFSAEEGSVLRQVIVIDPSTDPGVGEPSDLEEVEGGWLFASFLRGRGIWYIPNGDGDKTSPVDFHRVGDHRVGDVQHPVSITPVPGLGLVVRTFLSLGSGKSCLQVFKTPDACRMHRNMSCIRAAWIRAVVQGALVHGAGVGCPV
jgi:hypothetical protein